VDAKEVIYDIKELRSPIMAWGQGGFKSCDALLKRVEQNDVKLVELVILPMKTFGAAEIQRLSNSIASGVNTNLKTISASGHHFPPESLKMFGQALSAQAQKLNSDNTASSNGITHISIGSKYMGDEGVVALCEGLAPSDGALLQSLDLGWKNIGREGIRAIGSTFANSKFLSSLDLSRNNNIGSDGITDFCNAAEEATGSSGIAFPSMEYLTLSECNIGPMGMNSLARIIISDGSSGRSKRIRLSLASNPITSEGCQSLSTIISANPTNGSLLSVLELSQCSLGDNGIKLLSSAALSSPCTGLAVLDLSENSITEEGANTFSVSLAEAWPDLNELKLAKNNLREDGVVSVISALVHRNDAGIDSSIESNKNSSLTSLDLTDTSCRVKGAKAALMTGSLTTLRLFNNKLGSDGFREIAPLLEGGHPSIVNLDLGGNSADEDSVIILLNSVANTSQASNFLSKLLLLEIGGNKFGENAMEALENLKKVWPKLDVAHDKPVQEGEEEEEEAKD